MAGKAKISIGPKTCRPRNSKIVTNIILTGGLFDVYGTIAIRGRFLNVRTRKQTNRYVILPAQSMASGRPRVKQPELNSWIPSHSSLQPPSTPSPSTTPPHPHPSSHTAPPATPSSILFSHTFPQPPSSHAPPATPPHPSSLQPPSSHPATHPPATGRGMVAGSWHGWRGICLWVSL